MISEYWKRNRADKPILMTGARKYSTRQYVYLLICLILLMAVTTIGFLYWQSNQTRKIELLAEKYHLSTMLNCTRIKEEARHIMFDIYEPLARDELKKESITAHEFDQNVSFFLISKRTNTIKKLQRRYNHREYANILKNTDRLLSRLLVIRENIDYAVPVDVIEMLEMLNQLLVFMDQLQRLHGAAYEKLMSDLLSKELEEAPRNILLFLLGFGAIGFLVINKVLKAIGSAEKMLLLEKQKLENVSSHANCGLFLLDEQTKVTYANKYAEEWFGPLDQIAGKFCWELFKIKDPEKECVGLKVLQTGKTIRSESFVKLFYGEEKYFYVIASPVMDSTGKIHQVTEVVIDITERKQLDKELEKHRQHLQELVDERTSQLTKANKQLKQEITEHKRAEKELEKTLYNMGERMKELTCMYGVAESIRKRKTLEEIFQDIVTFIPPGWQYPEITCGRVQFEGKEYVSENFEESEWKQAGDIIIKGESLGTVEVYYSEECPQLDEGPFLKEERNLINGITRALSETIEHRWAKEELTKHREHLQVLVRERTAQLEEAQAELVQKERLAVLGQLTATVSHELRNPLGTIRIAVFSIGRAIKQNRMERVDLALELAERNVMRCDGIIEELLDFTRTRELNLLPTDIDNWLKEMLLEQTIPDGIECTHKLRSGVEISIDREHIRRAINNIVNNAIQALEDEESQGNKLTVETGTVDSKLEIRVSDRGPGIPDDQLKKIFEPLYSTRGFGVGLGVPIVKNIMERHDGGIEFQSEVGKGTTVVLWLPIPKIEGA